VNYKLNEGSGSVANNALGTNNGTLYNGPTWVSNALSTFTYASYLWTNGNTTSNTTASTSGNYTITVTDADGCSSTSSAILVTVNPVPTITATTDNERCGTGAITLGATASGGTVNWYTDATGGTAVATGATYSPTLSTSTTYYVDATQGSCTSLTRTAVQATINALPTITGSTNATVCISGSVTLGATASVGTVNWYTTATGGSAFTSGDTYITPELTATTIYYVDASTDTCTNSPRTAVTATVTSAAVAGTISGATPVCQGSNSVLTLNGSNGTIQWQYATDNISFTDISSANATTYNATNLTNATNYFRAVLTGGCDSATSESFEIIANPATQAGTLSGGTSICFGTNSTVLELADAVGSIEWQSSSDNITFTPLSDSSPLPFYMVTDLVETTYYKAVVTSEGCPSATSNVQAIQ
jgi:hypothetical protein